MKNYVERYATKQSNNMTNDILPYTTGDNCQQATNNDECICKCHLRALFTHRHLWFAIVAIIVVLYNNIIYLFSWKHSSVVDKNHCNKHVFVATVMREWEFCSLH